MDKRVYDYVKKYFRDYFPEKCTMMENEEINNIVIEVCKELKVYDRNLVLESKVDDLIFDMLHNVGKKNKTKLWNDTINLESYVSKFIIDNNISNCSDEITNNIIKKIVTDLIPYYNQSKINKGYFDSKIKVSFEDYRNKIFNDIYNVIYKNINNLDVMPIGINNESIARDLAMYFIKNGSYNVLDELEKGVHNTFIIKYVNKISNGLEQKRHDIIVRKERKIDSTEYIYNYIIENLDVDRVLSYDELLECASYINSRLSVPNKNRDRGFTPEEIVSPICVPDIVRYYNRYIMKKNSIEKNNVPKKVKPKKRKRFLQRSVSVLLLTASLLGVFGTGAVLLEKGVDKYKESISSIAIEFKAPKALDEFDDFNYQYIFYKGNDSVKPTALNAIEFHLKVQDSGYNDSNYDYLGFYRAYQNVRDDRLYIMDIMLGIVRNEVLKKESGSEFQKNISGASCYLEFAMDRLEEMGCEEINDQKYHDALFEYLKIRNEHPDEEVLQYMKNSDRKVVEDIMKKYQEYSDRILDEFSKSLEEQKTSLIMLSTTSGRGI